MKTKGFQKWRVRLFGVFAMAAAAVSVAGWADAKVFKVASYNVENLFDLKYAHTEYPGYIPGGPAGWNEKMFALKCRQIAQVLGDLDADVVALQEVESKAALRHLQKVLAKQKAGYPYAAITGKKETTVRCALLSRYPVAETTEIVVPGEAARNILRVDLDVGGRRLVVFVNHWKSKSGPESRRLIYAQKLSEAVEELAADADYLLVGDFNSNYNEFKTISARPRLNDTGGRTGINHVLATVADGRLVGEKQLPGGKNRRRYHYNLWREVVPERRWSVRFFGRKQTPDAFILPAGLYDEKGIAYLDNSFDKFDPAYLFEDGRIYRWQRTGKGRGRHLGRGYSDHLPVYACFTDAPFRMRPENAACARRPIDVTIADLYDAKTGAVHFRIRRCAVIAKHGQNAVIKQKDGRAIYVYTAAGKLEQGRLYNLVVKRLYRHYGNLEIKAVSGVATIGGAGDLSAYYIRDPDRDLGRSELENEVVEKISGIYRDGWFYYGKDRKIRLYFTEKSFAPEKSGPIILSNVRIGYHRHPELVVESPGQIEIEKSGDPIRSSN